MVVPLSVTCLYLLPCFKCRFIQVVGVGNKPLSGPLSESKLKCLGWQLTTIEHHQLKYTGI